MLKVEYINPFIQAAINVFKMMVNLDLRKGHVSVKNTLTPSFDVSILIGITGDLKGNVIYSMKSDTAKKIIELVQPDLSKKELEESYAEGIGEFANMITGNAASMLSKYTKNLNITTPTIIKGLNYKMENIKQTTIKVNMYSQHGIIEINIALLKL